jgi:hypothetical protein
MKDLDVFLPKIFVHAPGLGIPVAYDAIRDAAVEMCERTGLWRWEDDFTVGFNGDEDISPPYGAVLLKIDSVLFNGIDLTHKTTGWLDAERPGWRTQEATSTAPSFITQVELGTLRVVPYAAGKLNLAAKLKPADDCTQLPDFLADLYREVIAWGALGRVLMHPNQPYTNLTTAPYFQRRFDDKLIALSGVAQRGQQGAPTRSRATFF